MFFFCLGGFYVLGVIYIYIKQTKKLQEKCFVAGFKKFLSLSEVCFCFQVELCWNVLASSRVFLVWLRWRIGSRVAILVFKCWTDFV